MPTVLPIEDLRRGPTAALFEGGEEIGVSFFMTRYPEHGQGPDLHLHPYPEAFIVEEGTATFTVGDEDTEVGEGHVVVVPAQTPHAFKNAAVDGVLRVVSIHPSPQVEQTDL